MVKNTVNCYVPAMLAQGQQKRPCHPDLPLEWMHDGFICEEKQICEEVRYQLYQKCDLDIAAISTDDWHGRLMWNRIAAAMWF